MLVIAMGKRGGSQARKKWPPICRAWVFMTSMLSEACSSLPIGLSISAGRSDVHLRALTAPAAVLPLCRDRSPKASRLECSDRVAARICAAQSVFAVTDPTCWDEHGPILA
jgi:hypothetical protein